MQTVGSSVDSCAHVVGGGVASRLSSHHGLDARINAAASDLRDRYRMIDCGVRIG